MVVKVGLTTFSDPGWIIIEHLASSKAPLFSNIILPPPPSSAGVPRSFTLIPKSFAISCNPNPAPIDAVAMILCPHACPISGKASYSTHSTTSGPESPKVTSKAVSSLCDG